RVTTTYGRRLSRPPTPPLGVRGVRKRSRHRPPLPPPRAGEGGGGGSARLVGEFVRVGFAEIGVFAPEARDIVLFDLQDGRRSGGRHLAIGAEDGKLVLERCHIQLLARNQVVGRHLVGNFAGRVGLHPFQGLDV